MSAPQFTPEQSKALEDAPFTKTLLDPKLFSDPALHTTLDQLRKGVLVRLGVATNEDEALEFITPFLTKAEDMGLFGPLPIRIPTFEDEYYEKDQIKALEEQHQREQNQVRGGSLINLLVAGAELKKTSRIKLIVGLAASHLRGMGVLNPSYTLPQEVTLDPIYKIMDTGRQFASLPALLRRRIIASPNSPDVRGLLKMLG